MIKLSVLFFLLSFVGFSQAKEDNSWSAVILQYHHVSDNTPFITSVSVELFKKHLSYLNDNGFNVLSIEKLVYSMKNKLPIPNKSIVITFDDAYSSIYTNAWPILKEYKYPFTVFVNTLPLESGYNNFINWKQINEMLSDQMTIANHSHKHTHFVEWTINQKKHIWQEKFIDDITRAENIIYKKTGKKSKLFAWPYGEASISLRTLLSSLGYTGFGQQSGPVGVASDLSKIPRFPMGGNYGLMHTFTEKIKTVPFEIKNNMELENYANNETPPVLVLDIAPGEFNPNQIVCYSQDKVLDMFWFNKEKTSLKAFSKLPIPIGRSRFNCTAPKLHSNQYYWFSHDWIRLDDNGKAVE